MLHCIRLLGTLDTIMPVAATASTTVKKNTKRTKKTEKTVKDDVIVIDDEEAAVAAAVVDLVEEKTRIVKVILTRNDALQLEMTFPDQYCPGCETQPETGFCDLCMNRVC